MNNTPKNAPTETRSHHPDQYERHLIDAFSRAMNRADMMDKIYLAPCGCEFVMDRSKEFGWPDRPDKRCARAAALEEPPSKYSTCRDCAEKIYREEKWVHCDAASDDKHDARPVSAPEREPAPRPRTCPICFVEGVCQHTASFTVNTGTIAAAASSPVARTPDFPLYEATKGIAPMENTEPVVRTQPTPGRPQFRNDPIHAHLDAQSWLTTQCENRWVPTFAYELVVQLLDDYYQYRTAKHG